MIDQLLWAHHRIGGLHTQVAAINDAEVVGTCTAAAAKLMADRPRVAAVEGIDPLMSAANWMPELLELAGGVQPLDRGGRHSTYSAWSDVVAFNPQEVLIMPCGFDLARAVAESPTLMQSPGWRELSAIRAGRVYAVDGNAYFNRSEPRIVDSLEILAGLLHPELFGWPANVAGGIPVCQRLS